MKASVKMLELDGDAGELAMVLGAAFAPTAPVAADPVGSSVVVPVLAAGEPAAPALPAATDATVATVATEDAEVATPGWVDDDLPALTAFVDEDGALPIEGFVRWDKVPTMRRVWSKGAPTLHISREPDSLDPYCGHVLGGFQTPHDWTPIPFSTAHVCASCNRAIQREARP
jgi:hypothetical protein